MCRMMAGLGKEDLAASIATLTRVCDGIGASLIPLRTKSETDGKVAEYLVRSAPSTGDFMDIRVAVVGNVDAGKRCGCADVDVLAFVHERVCVCVRGGICSGGEG